MKDVVPDIREIQKALIDFDQELQSQKAELPKLPIVAPAVPQIVTEVTTTPMRKIEEYSVREMPGRGGGDNDFAELQVVMAVYDPDTDEITPKIVTIKARVDGDYTG